MNHREPTILQRLERTSARRNPELHQLHERRHAATRHAPVRGCQNRTPSQLRWAERLRITIAGLGVALLVIAAGQAEGQVQVQGPVQPGTSISQQHDRSAVTGLAQALESSPWGLTFQAGDRSVQSLALASSVHVEVTGLLARVHVVQQFHNLSDEWVEGTYRFPLPDGAAVDRLFIKVGERILEGEIRERDDARRVYQQARRDGRAAGLVTQERANQFSTRMANIGPRESLDVMIGFLVAVDYADGAFQLRLPMTFTPRAGGEPQPTDGHRAPRPQLAALGALPDHRLELKVDLDAGVPLATVESLYHDVQIDPTDQGFAVTLMDVRERMDRDFVLRWAPEFGDQPRTALSTWSDGNDVYAQLMLVPPRDEALEEMPREVIFVIDTSGSMEGASLVQARDALAEGLAALAPGDRFNLVQFNSETEALFRNPVPVEPAQLERAYEWLGQLEADGGTEMGPALEFALQQPTQKPGELLRQVVFITDGAVGNEQQLLRDIAERLGPSRLFTVAIGSAPNAGFMRKAAEIGRGHHTAIGHPGEVADTMAALWRHIRLPAVSDLCIDWGVEAEYYPEVLPDLYADQPLWVVARLPEAPRMIHLCGTLNGDAWAVDAWPRIEPGPDLLATLWAREKVEALQESTLFGIDADAIRSEITALALDHDLLTPYTSLVATDRTPVRPSGEGLAQTEVPGLLPAGSTRAMSFPATATGWKSQLALSLLALLIASALFLRPHAPLPGFGWIAGPFRSPVHRPRSDRIATRS